MIEMKNYKVCVIGAGVAGLATAKQLVRDENIPMSDIIVLDESHKVGGLWNRADRAIESTAAGCSCSGSPVYEQLHTNLLKDFMAFSDFRYPIECDHFPPHHVVQEYLESYSRKFIPNCCLRLNTSVDRVQKVDSTGKWNITCKTKSGTTTMITSEYVVVCTGHYRFPFVPPFKASAHENNSMIRMIHSSSFRHPSEFTNYRNVLIVGSRISAKDICLLLLDHNHNQNLQQNFYISIRDQEKNISRRRRKFLEPLISEGVHLCGNVEYINHISGEVSFEETKGGSGYITNPIDLIIFATGYVYKYPFLESGSKRLGNSKTPNQKRPLLNRIVSLADPSLMFVGTPNLLLSPGIVLEYQARYVAQLISGKTQLPDNFSSLLDHIDAIKDQQQDQTVQVGGRKEHISEFDMSAKLDYYGNPTYCNKLALLTNSQGYWSQLFNQRLRWAVSSIFYAFFERLFPPSARWLSKIHA
jgi:thioredoxin reductase